MNALDDIRAITVHQTSQNTLTGDDAIKSGDPYPIALKALAESGERLQDRAFGEQVVSQQAATEPQSAEARAQTAAVKTRLISSSGQSAPTPVNGIQIKVSDQETIDLPETMRTAENAVLQRLLSERPGQPIDLCGKASRDSLIHLTTHWATGETGFISDENAVELLLLAKEFELSELAMNCLERLLDRKCQAIYQAVSGGPLSDDEINLRQLLKEVRGCSIIVSRLVNEVAHVHMVDGSKAEQWDCLMKLHAFIPITHLKLTTSNDLERLLAFSSHNPNILSLCLGESESVTEEYLELLSQNLPKLRTFSIYSATVKAIPQAICERALTLICHKCPALTCINAPSAKTVSCCNCTGLTSLNAPVAEDVHCSGCNALTNINAPGAKTVECCNCTALTTINAPIARSINCYGCTTLTGINAPSVEWFNCGRCKALISIIAPIAVKVFCEECTALTSINVPSAKELECSLCPALTVLSAPSAVDLTCRRCITLIAISAPVAVELDCEECYALTSISADSAEKLTCRGCSALTCIDTPSALRLDCQGCDALTSIRAPNAIRFGYITYCQALTSAARLKLFDGVRRNIMLTFYRLPEALIELLSVHRAQADCFGLDAAVEFPLYPWFCDAQQFSIPAEFDSVADELECEGKITNFYKQLITYAANDSNCQGIDLSWFDGLRKLDSRQQQMSRVIWLGSLLASIIPGENPLADQEAHATLKAIGNLGDPLLQEAASKALFSVYSTEAAERKDAWMTLKEKRPNHLLVLCLFFTSACISEDEASALLEGLNTRYYMDFKVLNPMLEMVSLLSSEHSLTAQQREELLRLVLKAPQQEPRENAKRYAERLNKYRADQSTWVNACRDVLLFRKASELTNVDNVNDILDRHKETCQTIFGVKDKHFYSFIDTFKSERYPNGLFTYAARLQTLTDFVKNSSTKLLGEFVNSLLEGAFPENRYDLSNNVHLNTVFEGREHLLKAWKEPLEIEIEQTEDLRQNSEISPCAVVKDLMARAIRNRHLGADQAELYPTLIAVLESNEPEDVTKGISTLEEGLEDTQDRFKSSLCEGRAFQHKALSCQEIELLCLQVLDPHYELAERRTQLEILYNGLPDGIEFRHDVKGMLDALQPSHSSTAKWVKIETTDAWEDLLLMGTEVSNSCQRIDGDPKSNKCLMAYIMDGKNKLMIVRDSNGKIAARSVLRILWDARDKRPVLFMEQIYTASADSALQRLIIEGCKEKARRMGLPLVASPSSFPSGVRYMSLLSALGGPAPFEYVDALNYIEVDGRFTIRTSNIIYMPESEPTAS